MTRFCPQDCEYLSLTEAEQDADPKGRYKDHRCNALNVKLYHLHDHPNLHRHANCPKVWHENTD
jgi:hypothetical protein